MRNHLNEHGQGRFPGLPAVPQSYLAEHRLSQCPVCQRFLSTRFGGICPRCRPAARAAVAEVPAADDRHQEPRLPSLHEVFSKRASTKRYVPKGARVLWARCLTQATALAAHQNSVSAWIQLAMLPKCVLRPHTRGGRGSRNAAEAQTKDLCRRWLDGERASLWAEVTEPRVAKPGSTAAQKAQRCLDAAADAQYSKSCACLTGEPPVSVTPDVIEQMRRKHPSSRRPVDLATLPATHAAAALQVDAAAVAKEVRAFAQGSAAGPSGLRPEHLKNALNTSAHRDEVAEQLQNLVNLLAKGHAPAAVAEYFAGASLVALPKKGGGLRPVAVGETLRRLVGKCLCHEIAGVARERLAPLQVGVAVPGGAEAAVHASRQWWTRNLGDRQKVFVKLDLSNAFNTLDRQAMLQVIHEEFPCLAPWADWCYQCPSLLHLGKKKIRSECGVQQGDPLGPLFFSLALQRCTEEALRRTDNAQEDIDFKVFYLDDGTLAGDWRAVASLLRSMVALLSEIGLELSTGPGKCEVVPTGGEDSDVDLGAFPPGFRLRTDRSFELLGAPVGNATFCRQHTQQRVAAAAETLAAIGALPSAQVALHLLRQCASFCKLGYSARVVPPTAHVAALQAMDEAVRICLEELSGSSLTDSSWRQAQLKLRHGGLGLRSAEKHAAAAYVASRAACATLCRQLYPSYADDAGSDAGALADAIQMHNARVLNQDRAGFDPRQHSDQQRLSDAVDKSILADLELSDTATRAHLKLVQAPTASGWLQAPPCEAIGTAFPHGLMQVAIQRRLRVQLLEKEDFCPACGEVMDVFGDHALVCSCKGDRTKRHNALRNQSFFDIQAAGFAGSEMERPGLLPPRAPGEGPPGVQSGGSELDTRGRRPADIYLPRWRSGLPAAWDFAATSGMRADLLASSAASTSAATERYEEFKRKHLDTARSCAEQGIIFIPIVVESHGGGWGLEARRAFAILAKRAADASGEDAAALADQHAQRLSVSLQRENARAVLRRLQPAAAASAARLAAATAAAAADAV